tara:strand:+ start:311 stop:1207 length:897 start_codon:yes stop_codon:yes gene_type:complete
MSKWLYTFTVTKEEEVVTKEDSQNEKGEKTTTEKKEVIKKEIPLRIKKPNRKLYDEADLFYGVKLSEGIKAGLLTKTLLAKRYENDGGPMSNVEKEKYASLYIDLYEQENLVQKIQLNLEKLSEEERKEKLKEALMTMSELKHRLHQFEMSQQSLFDQTAEVRARNQTIMWWVLSLSYMEEEGSLEEFFKGNTYEEKLEYYDQLEEDENIFWAEAIKKFIYFVSFWESGQLSSEEDFKKAEEVFNKTTEEEGATEEEIAEAEDKEMTEIATEILSSSKEVPAAPKKKTRKKKPVEANA